MAGFWKRMGAIFRQRCPRCLKGKVFGGFIKMNENCPECGYHFEREQGYFLGAMYASYFLSVPAVGLLTWAINEWLVPSWTLEQAIFLAAPPFILVSPLLFRYSRVVWMHMDPPRAAAQPSRLPQSVGPDPGANAADHGP